MVESGFQTSVVFDFDLLESKGLNLSSVTFLNKDSCDTSEAV